MKKNRMMRLASVLLVLTLLTTSMISGTFAKYVTQESAQDGARVAKWGVTFDTEGGPLFNTQYATTETDYSSKMAVSVKSSGTDNVVAPGTAGQAVSFAAKGTPEVSYVVTLKLTDADATVDTDKPATVFLASKYVSSETYEANAETGAMEKKISTTATSAPSSVGTDTTYPGGTGYYPIKYTYTLGDTTKYTYDVDKLKEEIEKFTYYYSVADNKYHWTEGDDDMIGDNAPAVTVNWEWAFSDTTTFGNDVDKMDTTLGNLAAGMYTDVGGLNVPGTDYNLSIDLKLTATATQID